MSLPDEIAKFKQDFIQKAKGTPTRTSTASKGRREGKHNHFTAGDRGYAPRTTSHPVNIRIAKRG